MTSDKCARKSGAGMPSVCNHDSEAEAEENLQWTLKLRGNFNQELYIRMVLNCLQLLTSCKGKHKTLSGRDQTTS